MATLPRYSACCRLAAALLLAFHLAPLAAGQWGSCGDTGDYSANSTYESNLGRLSATLTKNASASRGLFATGSLGATPDIVYALTLCRGDIVNSSACEACVANAFKDAQRLCPYSKEVFVVHDLCYLMFSNMNFIATTSNGKPMLVINNKNVAGPAEVFQAAVGILLNATSNYAVENSSRWFATAEEGFDSADPTIYGLVQCTPDLSQDNCRTCLRDIIAKKYPRYSRRLAQRIVGIRCNYRYAVYSFFAGGSMLRLPSPAPAPAPANMGPPAPAPANMGPPAPAPANMTPPAADGGSKRRTVTVSASVACSVVFTLIVSGSVFIYLKWRKPPKSQNETPEPVIPAPKKPEMEKCAIFDLPTLRNATDNFSDSNKLGEGGFGTVYKGKLSNGQEIAVKKLSQAQYSSEALSQLHNEVQLLAELQHKNLVRLLGFCSDQNDMMLVYEHIKSGSLDNFLFDTSRAKVLNWEKRYNIILGIAKGMLYLHEDSSIRIIHRDLKANNILLDENMNPKIADFGLARLLGGGHTETKTARVVGTYGYMAPEYALFGKVSPKIDIFSFGVLVLEIVTGRRNSSSDNPETVVNLLTDVWNYWIKGRALQMADQSFDGYSNSRVQQCIHIGLLCVQENPVDRPSISSLILMLSSRRIKLQSPRQPAFFFGGDFSSVSQQHRHRNYMYDKSAVIVEANFSVTDVTNTDPYPR